MGRTALCAGGVLALLAAAAPAMGAPGDGRVTLQTTPQELVFAGVAPHQQVDFLAHITNDTAEVVDLRAVVQARNSVGTFWQEGKDASVQVAACPTPWKPGEGTASGTTTWNCDVDADIVASGQVALGSDLSMDLPVRAARTDAVYRVSVTFGEALPGEPGATGMLDFEVTSAGRDPRAGGQPSWSPAVRPGQVAQTGTGVDPRWAAALLGAGVVLVALKRRRGLEEAEAGDEDATA